MNKKQGISMPLEARKRLSVAAMQISQPVVFVAQPVKTVPKPALKTGRMETLEQAELRRERVQSITRQPPEVVITRTWIHTMSHFDAQMAVPLKLPLWRRALNWFKSELE